MDTMNTRELSRRDQDNLRFRKLLLEGAESPMAAAADSAYFESLRKRVDSRSTEPSAPP
jgi:antitoxin ParD1/3/4